MRQIVLLGNSGTKRTDYLKKAAERTGISVELLEWKDWNAQLPGGEIFLKIDPPLWDSCSLEQMEPLTERYRGQLAKIGQKADGRSVEFFNTPSAIVELLDKRRCKERLIRAGLPVTEFLRADNGEAAASVHCRDSEQLLETMRQRKVCQVFIKPVFGSGAAGVSAFRIQPGTGRMSLYTCASRSSGPGLANTKMLRKYTDPEEIKSLLDRLFEIDCVVERWYPKTVHGDCACDLRVVVQEQRVDYILARLSKGPITNLHLNNYPLPVEELGLSARTLEHVEELCKKAVSCFLGLNSAGIDILLEKGSLKPRIIEMNAQGDLIYQDIYHENVIYCRQAERMKAWLYRQS